MITLPRTFFDRPATEVAPDLLGRVLAHDEVAVRITEVEAYAGEADPASHAYRGRTNRNAVMFGPPGHLYVYRSYGIHNCINVVCRPEGTAEAVLLRAGEVITGIDVARKRSRDGAPDRDLARGPGRLTRALGIDMTHNGADLCDPDGVLTLLAGTAVPRAEIGEGPRTGISSAMEIPWRFYVTGDPTVSPYRRHVPRKRS